MNPIGNFKLLNHSPKLFISHHDIEAIQHIVKIAPQEAQWFHRLEKIENTGAYRIYETYIPEQYCSTAQVESIPSMMVKFYKELVADNGVEKTNEILQSMTVWCHSHHNMSPNPSGQDIKQFKEQCEQASEQGITAPQVMLIFNKKNQYYSQIWDPEEQVLYENVDIVVQSYDFDWIDNEAKVKFKKKPVKKLKKVNHGFIDFNQSAFMPSGFNEFSRATSAKKSQSFYKEVKKNLSKRGLVYFANLLCLDYDSIETLAKSNQPVDSSLQSWAELELRSMSADDYTQSEIKLSLETSKKLDDCKTQKRLEELIQKHIDTLATIEGA